MIVGNTMFYLVQAGADPNMGSHGVTPLVVAVCEGQTEIIKCLLKAGADPNVTNIVSVYLPKSYGFHFEEIRLVYNI